LASNFGAGARKDEQQPQLSYVLPERRPIRRNEKGEACAVGRRKTAIASVKLTPLGHIFCLNEEEKKEDQSLLERLTDFTIEDRSVTPAYRGEAYGLITINNRPFGDYFPSFYHRRMVLSSLIVTETLGLFKVDIRVSGGGTAGQADAIRHGIARALQNFDPDYRAPLKLAGLMIRDPRSVERKKAGRRKARKSPQWVKR